MSLVVNDDELSALGMNAEEARVEFACRLFQAGKLSLWPAAKLAGLSRVEMEQTLQDRKIPAYVITVEDFRHDLETLDRKTVST